MKIKSLLIASTFAIVAATGAKAADAVIEEPVPAIVEAPVFSWGGAYIGGQIGYGWGKSDFDVLGASYEQKPDGFLGGLYAGYNFDLGNNVILGIDGDITYNDINETADIYAGNAYLFTSETELKWSGAVRARAGYAIDRWLPYIAGGVAFGGVENTISTPGFSFNDSQTLTGWTVGAGVEYAATDNVALRLEYRYTDYGDKDFDIGGVTFNDDFKTHDIRLGIAYKF